MKGRSRIGRIEEQREDRHRPARAPHAEVVRPDPATVTDAHVVGQLPGAQLQRMAQALQGTVGNRGAGAVLGDVQRAPTGTTPEPASASSQVTVSALTARLVEKPSFIARTILELSRGDLLTLTGEHKGGWHRVVTAYGDTGWVHESAWKTITPKLTSTPGHGGSGPPEEIEIGGRD